MGYLRKNSFLIFSDPGAPAEEKTLSPAEIAEIEQAHEADKKVRVDALIRERLGIEIPTVTPPRRTFDEFLDAKVAKELAAEGLSGYDAKELAEITAHTRARFAETAEGEFESEDDKWVAQWGNRPVVTEADAQAAEEAAAARVAGPDGQRWRDVVQRIQDASVIGENAFKEYLRETYRGVNEDEVRDWCWEVYGVLTSKAKLPDLTYRPDRSADATVRFKDGGTSRLGINVSSAGTRWDSDKQEFVLSGETAATLWVKVADGAWAKDGNWGGCLQVTCATAKGQWIDSSDGWVKPVGSKADPVTFYDMGPYYEIWQKTREDGRPLVVQDGNLRFVKDATPGKFNLQDSTWD
ncbi:MULTISPECIES: hypothetical protein [unclassified Streptomyces]|uniref:hypothetical protein n=1 Tax=unclassified Streptomyces TaxID=2593676 RepID=UPI0035D81C34